LGAPGSKLVPRGRAGGRNRLHPLTKFRSVVRTPCRRREASSLGRQKKITPREEASSASAPYRQTVNPFGQDIPVIDLMRQPVFMVTGPGGSHRMTGKWRQSHVSAGGARRWLGSGRRL